MTMKSSLRTKGLYKFKKITRKQQYKYTVLHFQAVLAQESQQVCLFLLFFILSDEANKPLFDLLSFHVSSS